MTPTASPMLAAQDLNIYRNGHAVLDGVSLAVHRGDFTTIVGPNGAGKSLLLKSLLGLIKPNSGQVVRQKNIRIGYMPEAFILDASMPMRVGRFLRLGAQPDAAQAELIADTDIGALIDRPMQALSAGETQRVLLAHALADTPDMLILDEPAQNLDINHQLQFYKLLARLYRKRALTILMVSHDLHLVMSETRQVVCLFHHICCSGPPQSVARDPEFTRIFGTDMAQRMAVYLHAHDHAEPRNAD